ncbi:MAG: LytTR family DNA-binding domain-containing protein [Acutalibacteraceae bacterium]|nr:LytTR family DNA-binding domain-containing protein [Acutalibacteraceae bacterium]
MRIALCDRDKTSIKTTKKTIYEYLNLKNIDAVVDEFSSGVQLLKNKARYSMAILEYDIGDLNGLETARIMRRKDPTCIIIFLSQYTGFILDTFKVSAYRFLLKPLKKEQLFSALNDYFFSEIYNRPVWIRNGDDTFCFNTGDIFYIEANNKNCLINLGDERIRCNKTMATVYDKLPKRHFCKVNRAFIVNFNYVSSYSNDSVYLSNGERLPVSRNYYKSFKNEYYSYTDPCVI